MVALSDINAEIERAAPGGDRRAAAAALLKAGEDILSLWIDLQGEAPTPDLKEGFRLLALHRQGAVADPSFNACRETCRELVYHYNIAVGDYETHDPEQALRKMRYVARHLFLFISGKMQESKLGEFCCSSRGVRSETVAAESLERS
jgi:hypothetical protein